MAKTVTVNGKQYSSIAEAAKAVVATGKGVKEAAEIIGTSYMNVYMAVKGQDGVKGARVFKYDGKEYASKAEAARKLASSKSKKMTVGQIAEKLGISYASAYQATKDMDIPKGTRGGREAKPAEWNGQTFANRSMMYRAMHKAGMTNKQISEECGVNQSTVSVAISNYDVVKLAKKKKTVGEISKSVGLPTIQIINILKKKGMPITKKSK